jgi:hypothetical protein
LHVGIGESAAAIRQATLRRLQGAPENYRLVLFAIPGCVQERYAAATCQAFERIKFCRAAGQLLSITTAELLPSFRIMVEPHPQLCTRCEFYGPSVEVGIDLTYASRP